MPPPNKSSRYPSDYRRLGETALTQGRVVIPSDKPRSLKVYIQSYFRALEKEGEPVFADTLLVTLTQQAVIVQSREFGMHTATISSALDSLAIPPPMSSVERMAKELLESLAKGEKSS